MTFSLARQKLVEEEVEVAEEVEVEVEEEVEVGRAVGAEAGSYTYY